MNAACDMYPEECELTETHVQGNFSGKCFNGISSHNGLMTDFLKFYRCSDKNWGSVRGLTFCRFWQMRSGPRRILPGSLIAGVAAKILENQKFTAKLEMCTGNSTVDRMNFCIFWSCGPFLSTISDGCKLLTSVAFALVLVVYNMHLLNQSKKRYFIRFSTILTTNSIVFWVKLSPSKGSFL